MTEYNDGGAYVPDEPGEVPVSPDIPSQVAFPARAVLRTVVQALVGALGAWLARVVGYELDPAMSAGLVDLITALVWIGVTALAAWVMSRPGVARLLRPTVLAPEPPGTRRAA